MSTDVSTIVQSILAREPNRTAFSILVHAIDALPSKDAGAMADEIAPALDAWPARTRRVTITPQRSLGPAAMRLGAEVEVFAGVRPEFSRDLAEMPHLERVSMVLTGYEHAPAIVQAFPRRLRSVRVLESIPRRETETFAKAFADALERFDALEELSLSIDDATGPVLERLVDRPFVHVLAHARPLSPELLLRLEPRALRELHLIDAGERPAWDIEVLGDVLARLPNLTELTVPFLDARRASSLPALRGLDVLRMAPDALSVLPTSLVSLRALGMTADDTLAAFECCPNLSEINWVGQPLSKHGITRLTKRGGDARLSALQLNGALTKDTAKCLFTRAVPRRLRRLNLFGLNLGDAVMRTFAQCPAWYEHLVELDIQFCGLSDRGLADLLDVLLEKSKDLVDLMLDGNHIGDATLERLRTLAHRGVVHPRASSGEAPRAASSKRPHENVTDAWTRLATLQRERGLPSLGLLPPAPEDLLARARELPPSLCALYAGHNGMDGVATFFGFGNMIWWPLERVLESAPFEIDDRALIAFGHYLEDGEEPDEDEESYDRDLIVAIDPATDEVFSAHVRKGYMGLLAHDLGSALVSIVDRVESGELVVDEGHLVPRAAEPPPLPTPEIRRPAHVLATLLVERQALELREGATIDDLAQVLDAALTEGTPKKRVQRLLALLEADPVVDELYAGNESLKPLLREFV